MQTNICNRLDSESLRRASCRSTPRRCPDREPDSAGERSGDCTMGRSLLKLDTAGSTNQRMGPNSRLLMARSSRYRYCTPSD